MPIVVLSINHHHAPVEIREQVAFNKKNLPYLLVKLYQQPEINACVILSTCNRAEIIISSNDSKSDFLAQWLAATHQISLTKLKPYLSTFYDNNAIDHIMRVACGLDSLIIGEPQILGQLKEAYKVAQQTATLDKVLDKLFQHVFSSAKQVRTQTNIGTNPISIAYCGVQLASKIFSDINSKCALLIGANEMINLFAKHLLERNINRIIIANRTLSKAQNLANKFNASAIDLKKLHQNLHYADMIITSTASSLPILGKGLFETALRKRKRKPIFILDIAVPRDVEPEVNQLEDVYLYSIDDLKQVIDQNKSLRQQESEIANGLIDSKVADFKQYLETLPSEDLIKQYRYNADKIKDNLIKNALRRLAKGETEQQVIRILAEQLTNKLLHQNFQNIKNLNTKSLIQCQQCLPKN